MMLNRINIPRRGKGLVQANVLPQTRAVAESDIETTLSTERIPLLESRLMRLSSFTFSINRSLLLFLILHTH